MQDITYIFFYLEKNRNVIGYFIKYVITSYNSWLTRKIFGSIFI